MASNAASGSRDERFAGEPARRRMWLLPTAAVLAMRSVFSGVASTSAAGSCARESATKSRIGTARFSRRWR